MNQWIPFGYRYIFCVGDDTSFSNLRFENDVKMYGTQTAGIKCTDISEFENDVKIYGTQTPFLFLDERYLFENDVKMTESKLLAFQDLIAL